MAEHTPAPTPHRAIYGFAFFVLFLALFAFYLCWALVPDAVLAVRLGLSYMPDKYFVLFLPPVIMFALTMFGFVVYPAMNVAGTHEPTDERTVRDAASIRRCEWPVRDDGGGGCVRCDRRVEVNRADGWTVRRFCDRHCAMNGGSASDEVVDVGGGDARIDNYCDCAADARGECVLQRRPHHVHELLARRTVPSVCDLDVSEVSARLFGASANDVL